MTCATVTPVSRRLYGFRTDRERAIWLYRVRPISIPSVARSSSSCRPSRLQPTSTKAATWMELLLGRRKSVTARGSRFQLDRLSGDRRRRGLSHEPRGAGVARRPLRRPDSVRQIVGQAEPLSTFAKLLGRYSCASSERELFRPAATSSPLSGKLSCAPGGSIPV
jgi:hypothetical protein